MHEDPLTTASAAMELHSSPELLYPALEPCSDVNCRGWQHAASEPYASCRTPVAGDPGTTLPRPFIPPEILLDLILYDIKIFSLAGLSATVSFSLEERITYTASFSEIPASNQSRVWDPRHRTL